MGWRRHRSEAALGDEATPEAVLAVVADGLGATDSGVEFIYLSLERLQQRIGADDLIAVLDEPPLGRQVFRAGRGLLDSEWSRDVAKAGRPGIHARPDPIDPVVANAVVQLCSIALKLEVALHDSLHDHLTGLLNRRAFDDVLAEACARSVRYGWAFGLVLLDLDGFKDVNDRLGHPAGDAALQAVGDLLRHHLRMGDAAARLGGDEFAVLLPNLREHDAAELVRRLERAIDEAVPGAAVTLSVGVALAPSDGDAPTALYHHADVQLYERKRARR
ncbi:MAG TPA: GGDEF domain-containing protein [Acidimicrobiales bacterium]|nr:GGDEF domain-containing protein [Acidimicrobiales bacterium]